MPGTTDAETIKSRLQDGFDRNYYESLYQSIVKAYGEFWRDDLPSPAWGNGFPDYPDVRPIFKEIGISAKIQNAQIIMLSRVMTASPEPNFPDLDRWTGQVRQQYVKNRARGIGGVDGEWTTQHANVFLDGDGLGTGFAQIGLRETPYGQIIDVEHIPVTQMIWDPRQRSATRARWMCSMRYIEMDVAEDMFGYAQAHANVRKIWDLRENRGVDVVRLFEYYDVGLTGGKPTMAYILDDITHDPVSVEENPFGCLPFAVYEGPLTPGTKRATGRINMMLSGQEAISKVERNIRAAVEKTALDLVDSTMLSVADLSKLQDGEPLTVIQLEGEARLDKNNPPIIRLPGGEVSQTNMVALERYEREFAAVAGNTELDRGNQLDSQRTLGETQLLDQRSRTQANYSTLQLALYYRRVFEKVCKIGAIGDTAPVSVMIDGRKITLNTGDPRLAIRPFLEEESQITIDPQAITSNDVAGEQDAKARKLWSMAPLVQAGQIPNDWFAKEILRSAGYDPDEVLQDLQVQKQGMESEAPGAPGEAIPGEEMMEPAMG
jgi:hypothetical protein